MKSKISISDCRKAIAITHWNGSIAIGIPLTIRGEQMLITRDLRTQGKYWVCGDIRLPRASQKYLTKQARAIIADKDKGSPITLSRREDRP